MSLRTILRSMTKKALAEPPTRRVKRVEIAAELAKQGRTTSSPYGLVRVVLDVLNREAPTFRRVRRGVYTLRSGLQDTSSLSPRLAGE